MVIHTLSPSSYHRAAGLFAGLSFHLSVPGVLRGVIPGRILVDDPETPHSALMTSGHRFTIAGDPQREDFQQLLEKYFNEEVFPKGRAEGGEGFLIYYDEGWDVPVEQAILRGHTVYAGDREYYEIAEPAGDWRPMLPAGFELVHVDRALLDRADLVGLDALREEMCSERPSVEDFLQHSFGVSLLHDGKLVTWCLSEYNLDDRCEVGIATAEAYRRRGLATISGLAFLELANQHGIRRIGWHCWAQNTGSVNAALRIGFEKVVGYPSFFVPFENQPS